MILVEQSVNVALTVAETAYFMEKGEIRFHGPTAELLERPDVLRSVFLEGRGVGGGATSPAEREEDGTAEGAPVRPAAIETGTGAGRRAARARHDGLTALRRHPGRRRRDHPGRPGRDPSASSARTAPARPRCST